MNKYLKTFLGIITVVIPVILLLGLLFSNLSQKSFYPDSGEITVSGINSPVKVYFDDFGVPHIFAQNKDDAYFTMGYMHARDRLWQMDLARRVAEGRLSEIFGASVIDFDKLYRTIGIHRFSFNWYNNISPETRTILKSYTEGVNKFIETNYDRLPVEFDALNYKPDPWKPEQSLMISRLMGWDLNIAWYTDYIIGQLVNKAGIEMTSEIFPDTTISLYKKPELPDDTDSTINQENEQTGLSGYFGSVAVLGHDFFNLNENSRKFLGINGSHTGSNSWVVSSDKSATGKPILAGDPHLALQAPSRWYELCLKGGDIDSRGMTLPGIPGIVIGSNNYISWGLTNLMNDDNDFIILKRDSSDSQKYIYNNKSYTLDSIKEKIYVKDSLEVNYVIKTTAIGPVISDLKVRGFADFNTDKNTESIYTGKLMTFRWTGFEHSDDILSFYRLNTSKNWDDFINALKDFGVPAQNFIYADIYGNIGYQAAGKIPVRKTADKNSYIYPGDSELEWTGFVEFDKMPGVFNPVEGYIVTANTNPFSWLKNRNENFYISYLWEPDSRFKRIEEFLKSRSRFDIDDFRMLQNNFESPYAREISRYIPAAYDSSYNGSSDIKWCIDRFKNWNGEMKPGESIGAVYNTFLTFLIKNIFLDELGPEVFGDFLTVQNMPYRSLQIILKQQDNPWFDNTGTPVKENRDYIVRLSLEQSVELLKTKFTNPDINTWHWGELHKVKFRHPMGFVEALDKTFNIGPFNIGGDQTTVFNSEYMFDDVIKNGKFDVIIGPSMRMIVSMSDVQHSYTINSTGQSGQPVNKNYSDQSRMWLYGDYKLNTANETEMLDKKYRLLNLIPGN